MSKKSKNIKKAQQTIKEVGLQCYKRGMGDAIDIIKTAFQGLDAAGMKTISIDEAIVLVAQVVRAIHEAQED